MHACETKFKSYKNSWLKSPVLQSLGCAFGSNCASFLGSPTRDILSMALNVCFIHSGSPQLAYTGLSRSSHPQLHWEWNQAGSLKLAIVGEFTPWKLTLLLPGHFLFFFSFWSTFIQDPFMGVHVIKTIFITLRCYCPFSHIGSQESFPEATWCVSLQKTEYRGRSENVALF